MVMYQPGEMIVYGNSGVCRVAQVCRRAVAGCGEKLYYRLQPLYSTEVIYTPVDTCVFMRPAMTRTQAQGLIESIPALPQDAYHNANLAMLKAHYEGFFHDHSCESLLRLIRSIHAKDEEAQRSKKKLGRVEQHYCKMAEELLNGEMAVALGIPRESVPDYIRGSVERGGQSIES